MTYRRFETDNAEYLLQLMNHDVFANVLSAHKNEGVSQVSGIDVDLFDGIDGLVIESPEESISATLEAYKTINPLFLVGDPSTQAIEMAIIKNIPFYYADVNLPNSNPLQNHFETMATMQLFEKYGLPQRSKLPKTIAEKVAKLFFDKMDPEVEGRNAINAEKIEKGVVPRVHKYARKRKPLIGLLYGFSHTGLEMDLQRPRRRQRVIKKMRELPQFDASEFNWADEAIWNPQKRKIEVVRFNTNLF